MSSSKNYQKDPFYRRFIGRSSKLERTERVKKDISSYLERDEYQFNLYPFYLWVAGTILLLSNIGVTVFVYYTYERQKRLPIFINIILYYVAFYLFYSGKREQFYINKKKGIVKFSKINIFLSKKEVVYKIDEVDYIEIVIKGMKRGTDDHRKYFLRVYNRDKKVRPIEFGYTWNLETIKWKYQVCLAMIKGMVILKVKDYLIKDESTYMDYVY